MTWLRFRMNLSDTPDDNLIMGELSIMEGNTPIRVLPATSGISPHQHRNAESLKARGPVPACSSVDINSYFVRTDPFDRSSNPGIAGNFYHIDTPASVNIDGVERSEFGLHFDANVPGSAGCIVFRDRGNWGDFENFMADYRRKGFSRISLIVEYNRVDPTVAAPLALVSLQTPKEDEVLFVNKQVSFTGSALPTVKKVVITAGPGGPFPVGEAETDESGAWLVQAVLRNTGRNRPFWFTALDASGSTLGQIEVKLNIFNPSESFSTATSVFTIDEPNTDEQKRVNRIVKFSGSAKPEVSQIIAEIGPGGPFTIGKVKPTGGVWSFEQKFLTPGQDRPLRLMAYDASGNRLQVINMKISIVPGDVNLAAVPVISGPASGEINNWSLAKSHIQTLVRAFQDQGISNPIVYAYACASISRESSWNPRAENTSDAAARTGYPGRGLAQITWDFNYKAAQEDTGIKFFDDPNLMFDPYNALRAKAAFFKRNGMIPFIEAGDYQSAAGTYIAGKAAFRSVYTRRVANDVPFWIDTFIV